MGSPLSLAVHAFPLPALWVWSLGGNLSVMATCRDVLGSVLGHHPVTAALAAPHKWARWLIKIKTVTVTESLPLWRGGGGGGPLAGTRRRPAAEDGVPPFLQIPPLSHILCDILLARSPAPYSPFRPKRRPARLPRRTLFSRCRCRCSRMRARLPLHILLLYTQVSR